MFTWEEAGQLRSMIQLVTWGVIALIVAIGTFIERKPLAAGVKATLHRVEAVIETQTHPGRPDHPQG
jgi:hypothetical protein